MNKTGILSQFEALQIDPGAFGHLDHVEAAFEMLQKYSFLEACTKYANIIKIMAANAGAPEKFNVTITFAFLSLIAKRIEQSPKCANFNQFFENNPDLESIGALDQWYTKEQLQSNFARTNFLLPDKVA